MKLIYTLKSDISSLPTWTPVAGGAWLDDLSSPEGTAGPGAVNLVGEDFAALLYALELKRSFLNSAQVLAPDQAQRLPRCYWPPGTPLPGILKCPLFLSTASEWR